METVLLAITVVSLLVALIMSAAAWRMSREERARSAARVAALAAAASDTTVSPAIAAPVVRDTAAESRAPWSPAPGRVEGPAPTLVEAPGPVRVSAFAQARPALSFVEGPALSRVEGATHGAQATARVPELVLNSPPQAAEPPMRPVSGAAPLGDSFLGPPMRQGNGQRGLAAAAAVVFVLLAGGAYWLLSTGKSATAAEASAVPAGSAPLELISLRHQRQGAKLSLSGLVRNPGAGVAVEALTAVVFLFDTNGAFVSSAKAGVDFKRLVPGDESPFVIAVDAPGSVARYRVSFRTDAGVVPHVDRRGQPPVAATAVVTKN